MWNRGPKMIEDIDQVVSTQSCNFMLIILNFFAMTKK